jgi:hypothetical protein
VHCFGCFGICLGVKKMTNEIIILMVAIPVVIAIVAMCIDVGDR